MTDVWTGCETDPPCCCNEDDRAADGAAGAAARGGRRARRLIQHGGGARAEREPCLVVDSASRLSEMYTFFGTAFSRPPPGGGQERDGHNEQHERRRQPLPQARRNSSIQRCRAPGRHAQTAAARPSISRATDGSAGTPGSHSHRHAFERLLIVNPQGDTVHRLPIPTTVAASRRVGWGSRRGGGSASDGSNRHVEERHAARAQLCPCLHLVMTAIEA